MRLTNNVGVRVMLVRRADNGQLVMGNVALVRVSVYELSNCG